ncbi:hypothetical protein [Geodermatophilus tzadiensis]|nr:hypothetical protein [Geodermatophilus tzadiensis]
MSVAWAAARMWISPGDRCEITSRVPTPGGPALLGHVDEARPGMATCP